MSETNPRSKWIKSFFVVCMCLVIFAAATFNYLAGQFKPNPEIMKLEARDGVKPGTGLFMAIVDVSIKNYGAKGNIRVTVEVDVYLEGYYGKQDKTIFLDKGETMDLEFVFETNVAVERTYITDRPFYPNYTYDVNYDVLCSRSGNHK